MKTFLCVCCCLVIALPSLAQAPKKFTSLGDLSSHFDEATEAAVKKVSLDRLGALEAFVADKANEKSDDLMEARLEAAHLGLEHEKWDVAKKHAEAVAKASDADMALQGRMVLLHVSAKGGTKAAELKEAYTKFLADVPEGAAKLAYDATGSVAEAMLDQDDIQGAKDVWKALGEKFASVSQIGQIVARATGDLDGIGADPKAFPETVKDLQGNALSIANFKGKVLLLDFWATWCVPCVGELPNVIAAYKKLHAKGFEIVGISLDDDKAKLDKFLASHAGMTWQQFFDGKGWKNELALLYGVKSIPATYLVDQSGKVYRTGLRGKALEKAVEKLLAKSGGAAPKKS